MKKLLLLLACSCLTLVVAAQSINITKSFSRNSEKTVIDKLNYRVTYELTWQPSTDTSTVKTEKMLLLIGDSTTLFGSKNDYLRDSITAKMKADEMPIDQMMLKMKDLPRSAFRYNVLRRKNSMKTIYQEKIGMDLLSYEEPLIVSEWKITDEANEKAGYQCQKATTTYGGRDYEAWFTFEVPLQDGPYKFGGLPGLIVEMYDTQKQYHFTLVGLEKVADGKITLDQNKLLKVSRKKFNEVQAEFKADPIGAITRAMGGQGSITLMSKDGKPMSDKETRDMAIKNQKSRNNTIELEY